MKMLVMYVQTGLKQRIRLEEENGARAQPPPLEAQKRSIFSELPYDWERGIIEKERSRHRNAMMAISERAFVNILGVASSQKEWKKTLSQLESLRASEAYISSSQVSNVKNEDCDVEFAFVSGLPLHRTAFLL